MSIQGKASELKEFTSECIDEIEKFKRAVIESDSIEYIGVIAKIHLSNGKYRRIIKVMSSNDADLTSMLGNCDMMKEIIKDTLVDQEEPYVE